MQRIARKKKNHSNLSFVTILITLCTFGAIIVLLVSNLRIHNKRLELQEYARGKEEEIRILQERSNQAMGLNPNGANDDFAIERIAREQLLLGKPGEEVVFMSFPEEIPSEVNEEKKPSIWWNPLTWHIWR